MARQEIPVKLLPQQAVNMGALEVKIQINLDISQDFLMHHMTHLVKAIVFLLDQRKQRKIKQKMENKKRKRSIITKRRRILRVKILMKINLLILHLIAIQTQMNPMTMTKRRKRNHLLRNQKAKVQAKFPKQLDKQKKPNNLQKLLHNSNSNHNQVLQIYQILLLLKQIPLLVTKQNSSLCNSPPIHNLQLNKQGQLTYFPN